MTEPLIFEKLKPLLYNFGNFRVKMWLDRDEKISLYTIKPFRKGTQVEEVKYEYDDVTYCAYSLNRNTLFKMLRGLNSKGFYKEDFFVDERLIRIFDKKEFNEINPGNITYNAVGNFYEGDHIPHYDITFDTPTHFIFFNTRELSSYSSSEALLFSKAHPYFPTKRQAFEYLMEMPMKPNQGNITSGIMFFIPLSTFLITKLEIIGTELVLSYDDEYPDSQIRVKIYYENRFSKSKMSMDENLMHNYHLDNLPTYLDLIAYDNKGKIVDKLIFDFDPLLSPERGRIKFVLNDDYIESLIQHGENEEVEFKGFKNLELRIEDKNELMETVVSFANKLGGIILLGVDDDKNIIGFQQKISVEKVRKQLVDLIFDWCDPHIDILVNDIDIHTGERLIIIHVNKGNNPPYMKIKGRTGIFLRLNESDRYCNRSRFDDYMKKIGYSNFGLSDYGRYYT